MVIPSPRISILLLSALLSVSCLPQEVPTQWHFKEEPSLNASWLLDPLGDMTFHETYHPLREIEQYIHTFAAIRPDNVKLDYIGWSTEKKPLTSLSIKHQNKKKNKKKSNNKPAIVIMGAQHAREWISTSTALYIAHALLLDEKDPNSISKLLNDFDFYIIPVSNPDGYEYTWESDRHWYKNTMRLQNDDGCSGIDMNRNWGYGWEAASLPHAGPCAPWYPGEYPFQAPEVRALAKYFKNIKRIVGFIDLRSYGQMISIPYSHTCDVMPRDAEDILEAAYGAAAASKAVHGLPMAVGQLCDTLYRAPGNVVDWMYEENHVKYSYAVHLRDTGTYGYVLPKRHIRPTGEETAGLISYLAQFILEDLEHEKKKKKKDD